MTRITNKALAKLLRDADEGDSERAMYAIGAGLDCDVSVVLARELLAARKVVAAAKRTMADAWGNGDDLMAALVAYDEKVK